MSAGIAGLGWVTPLGVGLEEVWSRVLAGEAPETTVLVNPETGRELPYIPILPAVTDALGRIPRLRRASTISYLAVAAGLAALADAGDGAGLSTAVVLAVSNGGVLYTRRFYEQIIKQGAHAASPLLFPETVYNAPASHLAAQLGIDGASYTLVGDDSVGLAALHFATQLLDTGEAGQVVVVGAEECDWILCEGYRTWRLARTALAEGSAAVVLRRTGRWQVDTHPGHPFTRRRDAGAALSRVLSDFAAADVRRVITSANGTFVDRAESGALERFFPNVPGLALKRSFGEAPGASALQQVVAAALAGEPTLVTSIGTNHQASAALVVPT